jgi:DNA-directed RNA polymerase subunit RPC12/RpoP
MPSCPICKQKYISIEEGKYLFCKICGERIKMSVEKKKTAITSKGESGKGTNQTVLTSQPNMRKRKPMSKEEEM